MPRITDGSSPASFAYMIVEIAAAVRWHDFARGPGHSTHIFSALAGLFLIGMFYNQFLPGGTGGDIIKSYLLLKETDRKAGALLAVVFDRLIGLVALVTITVTLVTLRFDLLSRTPRDAVLSLDPARSAWRFDRQSARQFYRQWF